MINIKEMAHNWLLEHGHDKDNAEFDAEVESLCDMILNILMHDGHISLDDNHYDADFGDNKICECGHSYYRHFDTYDNMAPVGCKYCPCDVFVSPAQLELFEKGV